MDEMTEQTGTSSPRCTVEVPGGKCSIAVSLLRAVPAVSLLVFSLLFYLAGILLTLTILGAVIGIPIIIATYAVDAVALSVLINMRERLCRVKCPGCGRKRFIMPAVRQRFLCKRCGRVVNVLTMPEK